MTELMRWRSKKGKAAREIHFHRLHAHRVKAFGARRVSRKHDALLDAVTLQNARETLGLTLDAP